MQPKFFTNYKSKELFLQELLEITDKLLEKLNKISLCFNENLYITEKETYHFLTNLIEFPETRVEKVLFSYLANIIKQSETMSAKSSYVSILFSLYLIKEILKNPDLSSKNEMFLWKKFENSYEYIKSRISLNSKMTKEEDLYREINKICNDQVLSTVIKEALTLSGLEGKIHLENSQHSSFLVEMKSGYSFKVNPFKYFFDVNQWQEQDVKVLAIDGVIENVSELNNILNRSMETKIPMVIIAIGFSEEVVATLKANKDHGNLNIIPVRLPVSLESLNVINDIAVSCGTDVINAIKGEEVRFVDYENIPLVDKVRVTNNELNIENLKTNNQVLSHIAVLLKKRQENASYEDICQLMDNRIQSLFSHQVTIHLPNISQIENDSIRVKFDICLRTMKTLLNYGFVNFDNLMKDIQEKPNRDEFDRILFNVFKQVGNNLTERKLPTLSIFLSTFISLKQILGILFADGFIELN